MSGTTDGWGFSKRGDVKGGGCAVALAAPVAALLALLAGWLL